MNAMIAVAHSNIYMHGHFGVRMLGNIIEAAWRSDGKEWSFSTTPNALVEWVRDGFMVVCQDCVGHAAGSTGCGHVEFPAEEKVQAYNMVKAIKMDLL